MNWGSAIFSRGQSAGRAKVADSILGFGMLLIGFVTTAAWYHLLALRVGWLDGLETSRSERLFDLGTTLIVCLFGSLAAYFLVKTRNVRRTRLLQGDLQNPSIAGAALVMRLNEYHEQFPTDVVVHLRYAEALLTMPGMIVSFLAATRDRNRDRLRAALAENLDRELACVRGRATTLHRPTGADGCQTT